MGKLFLYMEDNIIMKKYRLNNLGQFALLKITEFKNHKVLRFRSEQDEVFEIGVEKWCSIPRALQFWAM